jgi:hypothetical protein
MKAIYMALGAAALALGTQAQAGALVPNKTVDISFDGFCDGMHLVINEAKGTVSGNSTGCISDLLIGAVGSNFKLGAGVTVYNRTFLFVIDDSPRKWTLSNVDGSIVQDGTYSLGVPAMAPASAGATATGER